MLRSSENETEILLGNKQLLGIFFVLALLLGVAFTGGFLMGRSGAGKRTEIAGSTATADIGAEGKTASAASAGGQTRTLGGEPTMPAAAAGGADSEAATAPGRSSAESNEDSRKFVESTLGTHKRGGSEKPAAVATKPVGGETDADVESGYLPKSGTQYLQVAAVGRAEAEVVADVLHKKGFRAHAVPKPGNVKVYRVIIGPVRDAGDLSSTRDALRKTGFREVIVQHY